MKYLSICSGIEACTVAWHPLGWTPQGFAEIESFRSEVLKYHYPEVKNYGDFTKIQKKDFKEKTDVLVGGTPCATFSQAGHRKGLEEARGNLALEFLQLAKRINPTWIIWENVFGVLSSNKGKDFATFITALAELGYGFAYRILDTQYIRTQRFPNAIPQRRRRVFVIGHIRNWKYPAEVLFNGQEVSKNSKPSRIKKQNITKKFQDSTYKQNEILVFETNTPDRCARIQKEEISPTLTAMTGGNREPCIFVEYKNTKKESKDGLKQYGNELKKVTVRKHRVEINKLQKLLSQQKKELGLSNKNIADFLNINKTTVDHYFRKDKSFAIPKSEVWFKLKKLLKIKTDEHDKSITEFITKESVFESANRIYSTEASYPTITAITTSMPKILHTDKKTEIRKITCIEAERLQGFPDNYTQIPYRGKPKEQCPDSKRYEAVGRSMSINVMEWLGSRIDYVHKKYEK